MNVLCARPIIFTLAAAFSFAGIAAQGQTITITSLEGSIEGGAYVYDFETGKDSSDDFSEVAASFDELPVNG